MEVGKMLLLTHAGVTRERQNSWIERINKFKEEN